MITPHIRTKVVTNMAAKLDQIKRAHGGTVCSICNKEYHMHPMVKDYEWITVLCDNTLIKL